ncbi:alkaline phosphatase family protein [Bradyrhizobium liaoningense]|uniref:alkaline phosphatase family protein n=1 Tax=Bradyrhizobium liaoningense TaxID=43992 RepID=UPI001BA9DAD3|nr:alkaline phosphatase family protein [Bradyrhizobium liaoningense]MBR0716920.1 alkaline phosphatase family protein [Bradyrhizobium liaoningense]
MAKIEHVFVLMLENRSFDHMLAFSGLPGVKPPQVSFHFQSGAVDQLDSDPPHEFDDVAAQIDSGAMDGFEKSGGPDTMKGFDAASLPVLLELAANNLYFDNWYSSMPGPTWPNRLFVHAASSGGLDNSMGTLDVVRAVTNPGYALQFENGHLFDRLAAKGVSWRVYHHHGSFDFDFPQVLALKGMVDKRNDPRFFRHFKSFAADVASGDVAGYTFIEPSYGLPSFRGGNSQHPTGAISLGEILIKKVHDAIFGRKVGANSAMLVTWDEHGGFFDHAAPPAATPPGDKPLNHNRAGNPRNCAFNGFGVRVPAVLISPWLPAGLGSTIFGGNARFDHASVVRALRSTFSLGRKLTNRDEASPDWNAALLAKPRDVSLTLPKVAAKALRRPIPTAKEVVREEVAPSGNVLGTGQIVADIDWHTAQRLHVPPVIASQFEARMAKAHRVLSVTAPGPVSDAAVGEAHLSVLEYIAAVRDRDERLRKAEQRQSAPRKRPLSKARSVAKPPAKKPATKPASKAAKKLKARKRRGGR